MEHYVNLAPIQQAIDGLREKYPNLSFGSDFDPGINLHRGIFDISITQELQSRDLITTLSIIVPSTPIIPNLSEVDAYRHRIEEALRNFGLIQQ